LLIPSCFLISHKMGLVYHHHLPPVDAGKSSKSGWCTYICGFKLLVVSTFAWAVACFSTMP
jgi:hypothetical protein